MGRRIFGRGDMEDVIRTRAGGTWGPCEMGERRLDSCVKKVKLASVGFVGSANSQGDF